MPFVPEEDHTENITNKDDKLETFEQFLSLLEELHGAILPQLEQPVQAEQEEEQPVDEDFVLANTEQLINQCMEEELEEKTIYDDIF